MIEGGGDWAGWKTVSRKRLQFILSNGDPSAAGNPQGSGGPETEEAITWPPGWDSSGLDSHGHCEMGMDGDIIPWPGDQLDVWHEGEGVSVTPGERLAQTAALFTELPRPTEGQIWREDEDFWSKCADLASCKWTRPDSSWRSAWAGNGQKGWALELQIQDDPITLEED